MVKVRRTQLEREREKSRVLEESLRVLAQEQLSLESSMYTSRSVSRLSDAGPTPAHAASSFHASELDEFFDCQSDDGLCHRKISCIQLPV